MGEGRNVYRVLMGRSEGKRPLGSPRHRLEDGNKLDLRDIGWGRVEWIHLAQDRDRWRAIVNAVMNLRVLAPRSQLVNRRLQGVTLNRRKLKESKSQTAKYPSVHELGSRGSVIS
jgi:hypothetical protein